MLKMSHCMFNDHDLCELENTNCHDKKLPIPDMTCGHDVMILHSCIGIFNEQTCVWYPECSEGPSLHEMLSGKLSAMLLESTSSSWGSSDMLKLSGRSPPSVPEADTLGDMGKGTHTPSWHVLELHTSSRM